MPKARHFYFGSFPVTPPASTNGSMLIAPDALAARPMSGTGWTYLDARATDARNQVTFTTNADGTPNAVTNPQLRNYEAGQTTRYGQKILGAALRWARQDIAGTANSADRAFVQDCLRYVIGTEEAASTDATPSANGLLSTTRNLTAFILAADLIGFDGTLTGSRAGVSNKDQTDFTRIGITWDHANPIQGMAWTAVSWNAWLDSLLTVKIGTQGRWQNMTMTSMNSCANQGAAAMATRTAIHIYRNLSMTTLLSDWRRWNGNAAYAADFETTADSDSTYWWVPSGETWPASRIRRAINPDEVSTPARKSGLVVDDIARSAVPYASTGVYYDNTGLGYTNETLHFLATATILLERAGHNVLAFTDGLSQTPNMFRRAGDWAEREGLWPALGDATIELILPWMLNWLLGTSYTTSTPVMGRMMSYADWLSGAG